MLIQIKRWSRSSDDDLDRVMIQIQSNDDDPDPVMLIQIERWFEFNDDVPWWSKLRDDPDPVMMSHDDLDREMIQIRRMKMTWRLRRLKMQMKRWSNWYREEDQCWKLCRKNTFLVKRECWCICSFGMFSSMYLIYCNPMFIMRCIYYAFESCFHALIFRSGGSII